MQTVTIKNFGKGENITSCTVQDALLPELTNQATLVDLDPATAGDSAPAEGELRTWASISEGDPGAFLSPAVEADGITAGDAHPLQ